MEKKISLDQAQQVYYLTIPAVGHQHLFPSVFAIDHIINTLKNDDNIELYGYCLFDDEIHLLLECREKPSLWIDPFLMHFNQWHQNLTGDTGYLFNDTGIRRILIQPKYAAKALRYIHRLPVLRKQTALPEAFLYSSYRTYLEEDSDDIDTDFVLSLISHQRGLRIRRYEVFMNEDISETEQTQFASGNHSFYFAYADEQFVTRALSNYVSLEANTKEQDLTSLWRNCLQMMSRITEFEEDVLMGTARNHGMPDAHYVLAWMFVNVAKGPIYHVAKQFDQDETTISLKIRSVELHHPASFLRYIAQRWQQIYSASSS